PFDEAPSPRQPAISRKETRRIAARKYLKPHFKPINPLPSQKTVEPTRHGARVGLKLRELQPERELLRFFPCGAREREFLLRRATRSGLECFEVECFALDLGR